MLGVGLAERRLTAGRGADERDVRLRREQLGDRVAQQAVVLDQHDRDRRGHGWRGMHLTNPRPRRAAEPGGVYAYRLEPLQPDARFHKIKALLGKAHVAARHAARMWASRIVVETRVSHILIVSDSPSRQRAVNRALEKELKHLGLRFLVNQPVPLPAEQP